MKFMARISLRHFPGKYRETEGAPGSRFEAGVLGLTFRGVGLRCGWTEALLRQRTSAFCYVPLAHRY